jgi:hypothetical protein
MQPLKPKYDQLLSSCGLGQVETPDEFAFSQCLQTRYGEASVLSSLARSFNVRGGGAN